MVGFGKGEFYTDTREHILKMHEFSAARSNGLGSSVSHPLTAAGEVNKHRTQ
jgi:hypothetical protein